MLVRTAFLLMMLSTQTWAATELSKACIRVLKKSVLEQAVATSSVEKYDYMKGFVQSVDRVPFLELELGPDFNLATATQWLVDKRTKGKPVTLGENPLLSLHRGFPYDLGIRVRPGTDPKSPEIQRLLAQLRDFPGRLILLMEAGRVPLDLPFDWQ